MMTTIRAAVSGPVHTERLPLFGLLDDLETGRALRDRAFTLFAEHKPSVVAALRLAAWDVWNRKREPISSNDVRYVLTSMGYTGNYSILVSAFPRKEWEPVGHVPALHKEAHARMVRTYRPRGERSGAKR